MHDAAPTHHLFGWCTLRHLIRVLDIIQPDPSHPSRGWRIIAAGPEGPATPLGLATCVERRGKHLRAQGLSCPQRTICHGWWTRVLIHSSTTPSSVSGSLATPPDRQRTAGIHAAVAPRTTLGGCPTRRSHVWCFPFASKCFPVVRRQDGGGGSDLPLRAPCSGHLRDPQAATGAGGLPKANLPCAKMRCPLRANQIDHDEQGSRGGCSLEGVGTPARPEPTPWFRLCSVVPPRHTCSVVNYTFGGSYVPLNDFPQVHVL